MDFANKSHKHQSTNIRRPTWTTLVDGVFGWTIFCCRPVFGVCGVLGLEMDSYANFVGLLLGYHHVDTAVTDLEVTSNSERTYVSVNKFGM